MQINIKYRIGVFVKVPARICIIQKKNYFEVNSLMEIKNSVGYKMNSYDNFPLIYLI